MIATDRVITHGCCIPDYISRKPFNKKQTFRHTHHIKLNPEDAQNMFILRNLLAESGMVHSKQVGKGGLLSINLELNSIL